MSCSKEGHLYYVYYCKKCELPHKKGDDLYLEHAEHKINRYYCPKCGNTHNLAQNPNNKVFIPHLKFMTHEIEYYSDTCMCKVTYCSRGEKANKKDIERWRSIRSKRRSESRSNSRFPWLK